MEDEYKVVCALSNGAVFDDLELPQSPVSRSHYSLKANISQTVHPTHWNDGAVARNPCVSWAFLYLLFAARRYAQRGLSS